MQYSIKIFDPYNASSIEYNVYFYFIYQNKEGWWYASDRRLCLYTHKAFELDTSSDLSVCYRS